MNLSRQFANELLYIITRESRLAILAGHFHCKPLTRWQRMKREARLFRQRFADALAVLRGTAEVADE